MMKTTWRKSGGQDLDVFVCCKQRTIVCIAFGCIALHSVALHCIRLHCIALHCIALHCIAFTSFLVLTLPEHMFL